MNPMLLLMSSGECYRSVRPPVYRAVCCDRESRHLKGDEGLVRHQPCCPFHKATRTYDEAECAECWIEVIVLTIKFNREGKVELSPRSYTSVHIGAAGLSDRGCVAGNPFRRILTRQLPVSFYFLSQR